MNYRPRTEHHSRAVAADYGPRTSDHGLNMAIDHSHMHLGKRPRRHDPRTLKLARYLARAGQAQPLQPPSRVDYTCGITDWGMMMNDNLGCCTIAAVGHAVQAWTANAGKELTLPDSAIVDYYEKWDGYNPADPATDEGGVELNVLNDWRQQGFGGQTLDAFVAINIDRVIGTDRVIGRSGDRVNNGTGRLPDQERAGEPSDHAPSGSGTQVNASKQSTGSTDQPITALSDFLITGSPDQPITGSTDHMLPDIATAIWLFGGAYIGVELPITAQNQEIWDVPQHPGPKDEPGSWGGHAIYLVGYDFENMGLGIRGSGLGKGNSEFSIPNSEMQVANFRTPKRQFQIATR